MGKVVTDPDFKIVTSSKATTKKIPTNKRWWQLWRPKFTIKHIPAGQNVKNVQYRYYCTKCNRQNPGRWEFKYDNFKKGKNGKA